MRFSLQNLVRQTLAEADRREQIKLAAGPCPECGKAECDCPAAKKQKAAPADNTNSKPERNEETPAEAEGEKTSSVFVEKLASAVDFCNAHFIKEAVGEPEKPRSHDPPGAPGVGPGQGTGTLELNSATPGQQSTETGQASSAGKVPATNPPSDPQSPGQTNPATALQTTIQDPPGGSEDWTNKDVQKQASVRGKLRSAGKAVGKHLERVGKRGTEIGLRAAKGSAGMMNPRHAKAVGAGMYAGGALATAGAAKGIHSLATRGKGKDKKASVDRVLGIMGKMAASGDAGSISAGVTNPHQSSPEGVSAAGEGGKPSVPGEVSKQESMVSSNEAATNYTKQQAKAVPKARMGEVLSEPAQKKSTDPVLHQNLDAASGAGVKLSSITKRAAAEALLRKIAQEGEGEDASPEKKERAQKLQELLQSKQQEKASMGAMPVGGGY